MADSLISTCFWLDDFTCLTIIPKNENTGKAWLIRAHTLQILWDSVHIRTTYMCTQESLPPLWAAIILPDLICQSSHTFFIQICNQWAINVYVLATMPNTHNFFEFNSTSQIFIKKDLNIQCNSLWVLIFLYYWSFVGRPCILKERQELFFISAKKWLRNVSKQRIVFKVFTV